jgi:exodeoxyribonuclease-3
VKLLSFNIRHGGGSRVERIVGALRDHNADFIVLPEYRNNSAGAAIRTWLTSAGYAHHAAGATELPAHNTVLVASRTPFTRIEFPELGAEARRCVVVRLRRLMIFGVYFAVMEKKRPLFEFLQRLPKEYLKRETLIFGDMNTGCRYWDEGRMDLSLVEEFGKLLGCGWTDAWRARNPGIREWSWIEPWGRHVGYRLDHALVSPALFPRVQTVRYSHAERESGISDHSALILELAGD